jgi:toxin HigB-1
MILSFRHKGLKQLFEHANRRGVNPQHVEKIAQKIEDMDVHSFRLHPLTGDLKGFWSVTVRANWRIIFRFENGNAFDVDLLDYH